MKTRHILSTGILSLFALSAEGALWLGTTDSDWLNPLNWDGGFVPSGVDADIKLIGDEVLTFTATISADVPNVIDLRVARGGGPAILNHTAGTITSGNNNWVDVGTDGGTGSYNLADTTGSGGTLTGFAQGSGSLSTSGPEGRIYVGGVEFGGGGGTGFMNINTSGSVNAWRMIIGEQGTGVVNMDNGTINLTNDFTVGFRTNGANSGNGTFRMSGGTLNRTGGWTTFGRDGTSEGHFEMSGGTVNTGGGETIVGLNGATGTFSMTGGNYNAGGQFWVGNGGGSSNGTMVVIGGTVSIADWFAVGREGSTGTLTISGTGLVEKTNANGYLEMGNNGGSNSTINLDGGTLKVNAFRSGGTSTFNFNGGTLMATVNETTFMGGLTNAIIRDGGAIIDTNTFNITVTQFLTEENLGLGSLKKTGGGTLTLTASNSYSGVTTISGGKLSLGNLTDGGISSGMGAATNAATNLVFDGGTLQYTGGTTSTDRSSTINATKTANFEVTSAATMLTLVGTAPVAVGTGGLIKTGDGGLSLAFSSGSLAGPVTVNGGILAAEGSYAGNFTVNTGGRLTAKHGSIGTLTMPALTLGAGSALDFELNLTPSNDVIAITNAGGLTLGSTALYLYDEGGTTPFVADGTYTIITHNNGVISNAALLSSFNIANSQVGKVYSLTSTATNITLTIATAVSTEWTFDGNGQWTTDSNWSNSHPDALGTVATFGAVPNVPTVAISVVGPQTVGSLVFDSDTVYTITGGAAGIITLNNGFGVPSITQTSGSHTTNTPISFFANTNVAPATDTVLTLGGVVSGAGLVVTGTGTVNLTNSANTYTTTTVNAGRVNVGDGGASGSLGTGTVTIASGAAVAFNRSDAVTVAPTIAGAGTLESTGTGALTFNGTATHTGATNLTSGSGAFINTGTINGTSGVNIQNTTTLDVGSVTSSTGNVHVFGDGALLQVGGTLSAGNELRVGGQSNGTMTFTGGTVTSSVAYIGHQGGGTIGQVDMSGGVWTTTNNTYMGDDAGTTGIVNLTGAAQWNQNHTNRLNIGQRGSATLTMDDTSILNETSAVDTSNRNTGRGNIAVAVEGSAVGTWTLNDSAQANIRALTIGVNSGSDGTVNINDSATVVSSEDFHIGDSGKGVLNMNGGSLSTTTGWMLIGQRTGSDGTVNVNGGTLTAREILMGGANGNGDGGVAKVNVTGGVLNGTQRVGIGEMAAGQGFLTATGGVMNFTNQLDVGANGLGVMTLGTGSNLTVTNRFYVGAYNSGQGYVNQTDGFVLNNGGGESRLGGGEANGANAVGIYNITGGSLSLDLNLQTGAFGNGELNVGGSGVVNFNSAFPSVGRFSTGFGILDISAGGTLNATNGGGLLIIGEEGTGILNVRGGTVTKNGGSPTNAVSVGHTASGVGIVNLLTGGVLNTPNIGTGNAASSSTLNFNGGTLQANGDSGSFLQGLDNAYIYAGGGIIDTQGHTVTIAQDLIAPTGDGVASIAIAPGGAGAGYVSAPMVKITDGGGTGATAIATIDGSGVLTGIIITNPGVGYTGAPTVTLLGGNPSTAAILDTATTAANATTGILTKIGSGTLNLDGLQGYNTLTTSDGVTNVNTSFTGGTATVNANATTNFSTSQTLAALNIGAGALVTLTESTPFAAVGGKGMSGSAVVPEPGSIGLLLVGALGFLGRRRVA